MLVLEQEGKFIPKVIDFDLAKEIVERSSRQVNITLAGSILGTPEYMSPEQAKQGSSDEIDTSTDVYGLGVVLYEMLTGTIPLDREGCKRKSIFETFRRLLEEDPPAPSERIKQLGDHAKSYAQVRQLEPTQLRRELQGDLDQITLKALQRDARERYASVYELARDIQRYLNDEPIELTTPSRLYLWKKFARKYRRFLATAAAFVVVLVLGIAGLTVGIVVAKNQQYRAEKAEKEATEGYLLAHAAVEATGRKKVTFDGSEAKLLQQAIDRHQGSLQVEEDTEPALRVVADRQFLLGDLQQLLNDLNKALSHYGAAAKLYEELAQRFPEVPLYRKNWARCLNQIAPSPLHETGLGTSRTDIPAGDRTVASIDGDSSRGWALARSG